MRLLQVVRLPQAAVELLDEWWTKLCDMLGVPLNQRKHQCCKQSSEYSGFLFDSFRRLMLCLYE